MTLPGRHCHCLLAGLVQVFGKVTDQRHHFGHQLIPVPEMKLPRHIVITIVTHVKHSKLTLGGRLDS